MVQEGQSWGQIKDGMDEWHGAHSNLENQESYPFLLGMVEKQVRREQSEMPMVVACSLTCHCKMEMKSNQEVVSMLVLFYCFVFNSFT